MSEAAVAAAAARRARLLASLDRAALILPAAPEVRAGRDLELRYRPDADLFYLTGYTEPDAVALLCPAAEAPFAMFVRPRDPEQEIWTGRRGGPAAAVDVYGADAGYEIGTFAAHLKRVLQEVDTVYFRMDTLRPDVRKLLIDALADARRARQKTGKGALAWRDAGVLLDEMRLIKDAGEIAALRDAARITVESFRDAARLVAPGRWEYELEAAVEAGFRSRGAAGIAFATIAATGANATVLHYVENQSRMAPGELVLLDAGAQFAGYCADVSRTFPVDGAFTSAQRDVYDAVLEARDAGIGAAVAGAPVSAVHDAALRTLLRALSDLGILDDDADAHIAAPERYKPYFPHRTYHWLGLDVHDVGDYVVDGGSCVLQPGMVLTIEPGLYFAADNARVPAALQGTGIRIEDDILITAGGPEVLTAALPARAEEIEALVAG